VHFFRDLTEYFLPDIIVVTAQVLLFPPANLAITVAVMSSHKYSKILLTFNALNPSYGIGLHIPLYGDNGLEPSIAHRHNILKSFC
jgi:hypothetical protein